MSTPMEKLAELEARMALKDSSYEASISELRERVKELLELVDTLKSFFKLIKYIENFLVFLAKIGGVITFFYAAYKFGLSEIADKVKTVGGK